jgi:NAD(P)-dependent dehydrogenase (short-subunit alcohol dehydrogenase family)
MGRLDGKVSLITGAASGMGRIAAGLFASEGSKVVLSDVAEGPGREAAEEIQADGGEASFVRADVSSAADAEAMVRFAAETYGGLNVLYNNAGVFLSDDGGTVETPEEVWDRVIDINLKGVWLGCKFGIPAMLESGGGSIINVASFVALMGAATPQVAYTATKGGVLSMTREIAVEYARRGIRANALCPGPIETPLLAELLAEPAARLRRMVHIPMGRLGQADEVARAALFLASDDSSLMTGAALVVDGGITAAYVTPE